MWTQIFTVTWISKHLGCFLSNDCLPKIIKFFHTLENNISGTGEGRSLKEKKNGTTTQ